MWKRFELLYRHLPPKPGEGLGVREDGIPYKFCMLDYPAKLICIHKSFQGRKKHLRSPVTLFPEQLTWWYQKSHHHNPIKMHFLEWLLLDVNLNPLQPINANCSIPSAVSFLGEYFCGFWRATQEPNGVYHYPINQSIYFKCFWLIWGFLNWEKRLLNNDRKPFAKKFEEDLNIAEKFKI